MLTLEVNSEKQLPHMEPDSAVCVNFSGANGYLWDKNTILSKPMVGYEGALKDIVHFIRSIVIVFRILFIAIGRHHEP